MKIKVETEISVDIYQLFERVGYNDQLLFLQRNLYRLYDDILIQELIKIEVTKWLKVKNMIKKKMSLNDKALDANGKDRSCKNCNHRPCPEALANVCRDAFIKGYKRGYQQASDEYERIALVIFVSFIICFIQVSKARAERDSYNKKNVQLTEKVASYEAAFKK